MKKAIQAGVLLFVASPSAFADVSHQLDAFFSTGSTTELKTETVYKALPAFNSSKDLSDQIDDTSSTKGIAYSYYLTPIKDDGTPIALRTFYQHPSIVTVTGTVDDYSREDRTDSSTWRYDSQYEYAALTSEYYFPSNTGVRIGFSRVTGDQKSASTSFEDTGDTKSKHFRVGLTQYLARNVSLDLSRWNSDTTSHYSDFSFEHEYTLTRLTTNAVFAETVGVALSAAEGKSTLSLRDDTYTDEVAQIGAQVVIFLGEGLALGLQYDRDESSEEGMAAGYKAETTYNTISVLPSYWFNEHFGLLLSISQAVSEDVYDTPTYTRTETETQDRYTLMLSGRF